jgi:hypothetical protein
MTRDEELWGMALMLLRQHGDRAAVQVAERIGELAVTGEMDGVELWREIAHRLIALISKRHKV